MKKLIQLSVFCFFVVIVKAGEYDGEIFPCVKYISSNDSIVWLLVGDNDSENIRVTYRIECDKFGKIYCSEEEDYLLNTNVENQYKNYCNWKKSKHPSGVRTEDFDNAGNFWEIRGKDLYVNSAKDARNVIIPYLDCILHVRKNKEEIWIGGTHCFVACYHNGGVSRIFFKDQYELMDTHVEVLLEGENCPEREIFTEFDEEHIVFEVFPYGDYDPNVMSVVSHDSICFCDGRKIGYINDDDGFVNFRTEPNISAPVIGIILNKVRIFFWNNENNGDWYRVVVNDTEGYVHKSRIKLEKN